MSSNMSVGYAYQKYILFINILLLLLLLCKFMLVGNNEASRSELDPRLVKIYKSKVAERKGLLNGKWPEEYTKLTNQFLYGMLYTTLGPEVKFLRSLWT